MHQGFQAGLEDGDFAALQATNLLPVRINANDRVAYIRKTGTGDQSDIARANN